MIPLFFSVQHHHSVGEGPWKRRLRAHHQAVSQRARIHRQRQLRHLQRLREDLGRGSPVADRGTQRRRPAGRPARLRKPARYSFEGAITCFLFDQDLKTSQETNFPSLFLFTSVRFWRSWGRSFIQWRTPKVLGFSLRTSESSKETELISTPCKRYVLLIDAVLLGEYNRLHLLHHVTVCFSTDSGGDEATQVVHWKHCLRVRRGSAAETDQRSAQLLLQMQLCGH